MLLTILGKTKFVTMRVAHKLNENKLRFVVITLKFKIAWPFLNPTPGRGGGLFESPSDTLKSLTSAHLKFLIFNIHRNGIFLQLHVVGIFAQNLLSFWERAFSENKKYF